MNFGIDGFADVAVCAGVFIDVGLDVDNGGGFVDVGFVKDCFVDDVTYRGVGFVNVVFGGNGLMEVGFDGDGSVDKTMKR